MNNRVVSLQNRFQHSVKHTLAASRKRHPVLMPVVCGIVILVIAARAALPTTIQWYVNREIDKSTDYVGSIGDVDLQLIAGAYQVQDVTLSKASGAVPVPLFSADEVRFSILWSALLHGAIVSEVDFIQADINLVDSESEEGDQTGEESNWIDLLSNLAPFRIDRLAVEDSNLHFHNFEVEDEVDVSISHINGTVTNISNSRSLTSDMIATVEATGEIPGNGAVELTASYNPDREYPTFNLDGRVTDMPVTAIDSLIKAYAPFDVEGGMVTVTTELAGSDGEITGYVKPLITNLEVFEWREDVVEDKDNPLQILWESLVGFFSELLENQPKDQLATIVPVSGRLDEPDTDNVSAFFSILKNAFVEAFTAGFENTVSADDSDLPASEEVQESEDGNAGAEAIADNE